jgi:hypothetical protein
MSLVFWIKYRSSVYTADMSVFLNPRPYFRPVATLKAVVAIKPGTVSTADLAVATLKDESDSRISFCDNVLPRLKGRGHIEGRRGIEESGNLFYASSCGVF